MIDENIYELMKHSFGGSVHTIYVPSMGRNVMFKEPTVRENKLIAKIVIANQNSQSIVYATTLALIKGLCVEKDFDQRNITEFDRLSILAGLFTNNFLSKQMTIRCQNGECKHSFIYNVRHGDLLKAIESSDVSDIVFENKTENGDIRIVMNYPTTAQYLEFLEFIDSDNDSEERATAKQNESNASEDRYSELNNAFSEIEQMQSASSGDGKGGVDIQDVKIAEMIGKRKAKVKSAKGTLAGNIEINGMKSKYSIMDTGDLYIREIAYHIKDDPQDYRIVFDNSIGFEDRERILGMFPMSFFTNSDGVSMLEYSADEIERRMKACVPAITCPKCGMDIGGAIGLQDFFIRG